MIRWLALVGLLLVAALPTAAAAQPAGTLIDAQAVEGAPAGAQAWRVRYWTRSERDVPIAVTGMIVAPVATSAAARPVLAWAHGTWGVARRCAPSASSGFFEATPGLSEALSRGYVVAAADYPGLGSDLPHAYLGGPETARSVIDAVRAARQVAAAGPRYAVWGESQGGHAALWTAQIARAYAPELELVGVAAAAPPTDLVRNLRAGGDPSVRAFLTAFTADSWSRAYGAPLASLGRRTTQGVITRLAQNTCVELGARPRFGMVLGLLVLRRELKNVDLGRIEPWASIARRNSPAPRDPGVPMLIAQSADDRIVAADVTLRHARALCGTGASVVYLRSTSPHETMGRETAAPTLDWIADRFAAVRARDDCKRL